MRALPKFLAFVLLASPLQAQSAPPADLQLGEAIQVRLRGDTAWQDGQVVGIGECRMVTLPSMDRGVDGFIARSFAGTTAVRTMDAQHAWHLVDAAQLAVLSGCRPGEPAPPPPAPECGSGPGTARAGVLGLLYGQRPTAGGGSPWDPFLGLTDEEITTVAGAGECGRIVAALAVSVTRAASDTLPLLGVVRLRDLGFVVVRGAMPETPGARGAMSHALLSSGLQILSYKRFTF